MKTYSHNWICTLLILVMSVFAGSAFAQNSLPAPGSGASFRPNYSGGWGNGSWGRPGGWSPAPAGPSYWGAPWYQAWNQNPVIVVNPTDNMGNTPNQGTLKVIANGYDATGVWRVLPLWVSYQWNGAQYNVNVLNAWNPWTDQWNKGLDIQAFNTNYILRNVTYDFYAVLPFGTFYFNL